MPRSSLRLSQGFTLTELLVVIAIIAVLAAIAFPGFQSMVENSRTAQCTSNLREIYPAIQGYVQDNNGQYPLARGKSGITNMWFAAIGPYLSEGRRFEQAKIKTGPSPQNIPFACPSCTKHGWEGAGIDVGINAAQVGAERPDRSDNTPRLTLARVTAPSTTLLVADSVGPGSWSLGSRVNNGEGQLNPDGIAMRHKGRANVLYFDGHVGQVTAEQLQDSAFVDKLRGPLFQR
jgi:prepilin-type N-terminal cleavage/methylation domain-containing protein/prepilin-type processing-associated H-X9-DG protein